MNEDNEKLIQEQFSKLPEDLRKTIESVPWKSSIKEIAQQNNLSPEQSESLERESMFILYGFESPNDYIANLVREVAIPEETAIAIAETVNERIFKVIESKIDGGENKPAAEHNLPMVEPGEVAHDVPHVEKPKIVAVPDYRYPDGKDPYHEPLA